MEDVFEPSYSPRKIEFWLDHWEELETLVYSPKSAAHIAEHLNREWFLLQVRLKACLCKELHDEDSRSVDPACAHMPSGGIFRAGTITALCVSADLRQAADALPPGWIATRQIWQQQLVPYAVIVQRVKTWRLEIRENVREPIFARSIAIRRMATMLGWRSEGKIQIAA